PVYLFLREFSLQDFRGGSAISRKPDHDYAELQDKIGVMSTIGYNGTKILEIDSRAPYSEVLEQAQKAVSLVAIVSDRRSLT
ncbi:hypothetical protein HEP11_021470, partial [Escherichia coli]|nr:hypothetical protein [Escherichia coli]MBB8509506.1 hypothetical protein [Escherichia coli]